jgi:predicted dienelactone hydrolase
MPPMKQYRWLVHLTALALAACGGTEPDRSVEQPGTFSAGTRRFVVEDTTRGRQLTVQAWYPAEAGEAEVAMATLEAEPVRTQYAGLLATAGACPSRTASVAVDAPAAPGSFPLLLFSHCHNCTRLSNATTAARLASHGFVVLAVDHADNTLWDHLAGHDADLDSAFLEVRAGDVRFVLDRVAAGETPVAGAVDLGRVGVFGHSFGAVTAGRVAQLDDRIGAAAALCAPMENPLIQGVTLAELREPLLFLVAQEDNSITELGNLLLRNNFRDAPGPAWKLEVTDAGHWSVSDLDGLVDIFAPGCGTGVRQTDGEPFAYLEPETGRALTAAYVTAFFRATLDGDAGARAYLESEAFGVAADHHD